MHVTHNNINNTRNEMPLSRVTDPVHINIPISLQEACSFIQASYKS